MIPTAPGRVRQPSDGSRFRPEIEGLRAIASLLVVIYHVWIGRVSGGVDVFFALTGFLAAGQLVRAAERGGIDLVTQWGRTLRRLVPPAAVVLVGTMIASLVFLPESRWPQAIREVVASAFFVENWRLAADAVDYYASHNTASVVQHFWSLSIQGQFAIVFPVVIVVATLVARRAGLAARPAVAGLLLAITALSLAWSILSTAHDQTYAYFDALARIWEFTLGGLLALNLHRLRLPDWAGVALGWAGLLGLALCGTVLDVEGGFPGYLALWPVLCAVAVIVAGDTAHRFGSARWLSSRPMQYLGSISFPLYLWHWPVLLLAQAADHREEPGPVLGLAVVLTSLALAAATRAHRRGPAAAPGPPGERPSRRPPAGRGRPGARAGPRPRLARRHRRPHHPVGRGRRHRSPGRHGAPGRLRRPGLARRRRDPAGGVGLRGLGGVRERLHRRARRARARALHVRARPGPERARRSSSSATPTCSSSCPRSPRSPGSGAGGSTR